MYLKDRIVVEDWKVFDQIAGSIWLGQAFAFVGVDAASHLKEGWLNEVPGSSRTGPWVIPLVRTRDVRLSGVKLRGIDLPRLPLATVNTDKTLYEEGRDEVHVFACVLTASNSPRMLKILANGAEYARRIVDLDAFGCGSFALRDLPAGDFQLRWEDADRVEPSCEFTVAAYRLVPLVASVQERRVEGAPPRLAMKLRLESFGVPVHGPVRLELLDAGIRAAELRTDAHRGVIECQFVLTGEGPHVVNIQMVADPSQTATVPILGTRQHERSETVFSRLGPVVVGSLLPSEDWRAVRGIHVEPQGTETAPFHLRRIDESVAHLDVKAKATSVCVLAFDLAEPSKPPVVVNREEATPGETIEIEMPGPVSLVAIAAFVEGNQPWEGWAAMVRPNRLNPRVDVPRSAEPGDVVDISVEIEGAADGVAYVVVKDARLMSTDSPTNRLAGQIKRAVQDSPIDSDEPRRLSTVASRSDIRFIMRSAIGSSGDTASLEAMAAAPDAAAEIDPFASADSDSPEQYEDGTEAREREGDVVFAGLLPVRNHRAEVQISIGNAFAEYLVEAFVCSGSDWAASEARFQVTKDPYAELQLPAFVHAQDGAMGRLHVGAASSRLQVQLTCDGAPVPLYHDGEPVDPDQPLEIRRGQLTFLATPGEYRAVVADLESGTEDRVSGSVDMPGKLRSTAQSIQILQPGERRAVSDDDSYRSMRVLPGLDKPFRVLVEATSGYAHLCCEQTAAKMLAASAMYVMSHDDVQRRDRAEAILIAGAEREREMWLPGKGLKMYPESPNEPDSYWGPGAARHLHFLSLLRSGAEDGLSRPLHNAVVLSCEIAADAIKAYRIEWPPERPRSCHEAYAVVRFGGDGSVREEALAWVREHIGSDQPRESAEEFFPHGNVAVRAESAYAAAVLFRAGSPGDLTTAIKLANEVVAQFGEEGRLYSTVDSIAAVALMAEMREARVVGETGTLVVDGQELLTNDAALIVDPKEIEAREGTVVVEVRRTVEDDWDRYAGQVPLRVTLEQNGRTPAALKVGDAVDLVVQLTKGYSTGDVLWVCLPDVLSRIVGGGQVKRLSVDFQGHDELRVALTATSPTLDKTGQPAANRFGVCVRNMFEEERAGSPGLLEVTVRETTGGVSGASRDAWFLSTPGVGVML